MDSLLDRSCAWLSAHPMSVGCAALILTILFVGMGENPLVDAGIVP